jgi:hypothetical protein
MELSTCRGMSNRIEFTAIVEYYTLFGIGSFEEFLYIIREMDNELIRLDDGDRNKKNSSRTPVKR